MLTFLTNNWFVIAGFGGVLLKFGRDQQKLADMRQDIVDLTTNGEKRDKLILGIKEDVGWICGRLGRKHNDGNGHYGEGDFGRGRFDA